MSETAEAGNSRVNSQGLPPALVAAKWQKGQTGNPAGVPKAAIEARKLARSHAPLAIQTLVDCCRSKKAPWAARVNAAQALLNRGFGMPKQEVDVNAKLTLESLVLRSLGEPEIPAIDAEYTEDTPPDAP